MLKTSPTSNDNGTNKVSECNAVDESPSQRQREGQQPPVPPTEQSTVDEICYDLAHFRTVRVLSNNSTHKCVALLGHFTNLSPDKQAIVVLEKRAFTEAEITTVPPSTVAHREAIANSESEPDRGNVGEHTDPAGSERTFFTTSSRLHKEFVNDVYGNFQCTVDPELNRLKVSIIYPASEKHIVKHCAQLRYMVNETIELYKNITLPHLEQEQLSLEWLYNVLEHRKEKERILYEDPCDENGFVLLPDLKWDGKTIEQLYLLALVRRRDIRSLRDLTAAHLPLLRNVQSRGIAAIEKRYGIGASQLRIYLHYQPTFYHLHMHFTYLRYDPPGTGCEKAHLLSTVINNIELVDDYYQRATLSYTLKETDKLYAKFLAAEGDEPAAKRAKTDIDSTQRSRNMIPSTGKIDRLLVELRPRLQCANFFISFPRKFADIESTTIELANDRITIVMKGERVRYEIRTGDYFQLHTQTLSSLVIKNRYICFRINTNESVFGSERLCTGQEAEDNNPDEELFRLSCNVEAGKPYRVLCNNCGGPLVQLAGQEEPSISFNRVLELPSEQLDTDDWFCHRHDHPRGDGEQQEACGHTHGEPSTPSLSTNFEPQQCDLFYGTFYALLHRSVLQRVHVRKERFVYCKRCLQYLGSTRKNRSSVKLWYENVRFQPDRSTIPLALFRTDDALTLFHHLVRKTVREFNFVTHLGLPPSIKLMFELRRPGMEGDVFYLLMQIMDCQLSVFRAKQKRTGSGSSESCSDDVDDDRGKANEPDTEPHDPNGESNDEEDDGDDVFVDSSYRKHTIKLERHRAMKLMYRYEKYEEQPLFVFWREDSNVVNLELSESMFSAAIRYLDANSSYVPECYRVNLGFSMSYLDIP